MSSYFSKGESALLTCTQVAWLGLLGYSGVEDIG